MLTCTGLKTLNWAREQVTRCSSWKGGSCRRMQAGEGVSVGMHGVREWGGKPHAGVRGAQ